MLITFPIFGMARIHSNWQTKDFVLQPDVVRANIFVANQPTNERWIFISSSGSFVLFCSALFCSAFIRLSLFHSLPTDTMDYDHRVVNCMNKWWQWTGNCDVIHVKNCNNSLLIITFFSLPTQLFIHMHRTRSIDFESSLSSEKYTQYTRYDVVSEWWCLFLRSVCMCVLLFFSLYLYFAFHSSFIESIPHTCFYIYLMATRAYIHSLCAVFFFLSY